VCVPQKPGSVFSLPRVGEGAWQFFIAVGAGLVVAAIGPALPRLFGAVSPALQRLAEPIVAVVPWWLSLPTSFFAVFGVVSMVQRLIAKRKQPVTGDPIAAAVPIENADRLSGEVLRFDVLNAKNLAKHEVEELWGELGRVSGEFYYLVWIQVTTRDAPSRATKWRFRVKANDGNVVECHAIPKAWAHPPDWPDIEYCSLDFVQNAILDKNHVYNVFAVVRNASLVSKLDPRSFEARFTDSRGNEIICTMDGMPDAQSIAARVTQAAGPKERLAALGTAIREVLVLRYGSVDADAEADPLIKAEVIQILGPLLKLVEQDVGQAETVSLIRMNGIYNTVRGLGRIADQLSILAGKMSSETGEPPSVEPANDRMLEVDLRSAAGVLLMKSMLSPQLWVYLRVTSFAPYPLRVTHLTARLSFGQLTLKLALDQPFTIAPFSTRSDVGLSDTPDTDKVVRIEEFVSENNVGGKTLYVYVAIAAESPGGPIEKSVPIERHEPELRTIIR